MQFGVDGNHLGLPRTQARQVGPAIEAVGAQAYADAPIGLLSGGQQQRLRIAQALAGGPRLLLCDEPLLALDPSAQQEIVAVIDAHRHEHGTTVIYVTAEARGVPVGRLGLLVLVVLALTVTGAPQVVGTLLVLSLAITPAAAAAQRLSANPLVVAGLSVLSAVVSADGGLLASFQQRESQRVHHQSQLRHLRGGAAHRSAATGPPPTRAEDGSRRPLASVFDLDTVVNRGDAGNRPGGGDGLVVLGPGLHL